MKKMITSAIVLLLLSFNAICQTVYNSVDTKFSKQVNIGKGGNGFVKTDTSAWLEIGLDNSNRAFRVSRGDTASIISPTYGLINYQMSNGKLYYRNATNWVECGGGSGGSSSANNGLSISSPNIQLGGSLIKNTTINGKSSSTSTGYELIFDSLKKFTSNFENVNFNLHGSRFLHTTSTPAAWNGNVTYGNMWVGYRAGAGFLDTNTGYANTGFGRGVQKLLNGISSSNAGFGYGAQENLGNNSSFNTAIGIASQGGVTTATGLTTLGHHAGLNSTNANNTVLIGRNAGVNCNAIELVGVGFGSMTNATGVENVGVGAYSGDLLSNGTKNTFIGWSAGRFTTTATENTMVGDLAGGSANQTVGYNTGVGSGVLKNVTTGNTLTGFGRMAGAGITTASGSIAIGNNAMSTGNYTDAIVIGRNINVSANSEMNIGSAIYGENLYIGNPRIGIGATPLDGTVLDLSNSNSSLALPRGNSSTAIVGSTTIGGALRYNTDLNLVTAYTTPNNLNIPISKLYNTQKTTSTTGQNIGLDVQTTFLDASLNSITQALPSPNTVYKNWKWEFSVINATTNSVTFGFGSNTYLAGNISTGFTAQNGDRVIAECDGNIIVVTIVRW